MKKNITFKAEVRLISQAREKALKNKQTLNAVFEAWLKQYACNDSRMFSYETLMNSLKHVESGKSFSRDELNER